MMDRTDRRFFANWWWTVDHSLLTLVSVLMCIGVFLSFSATPVLATKLALSPHSFVFRHVVYLMLGLGVMFVTSALSIEGLRRFSFFLLGLFLICLFLAFFTGIELKGARRWLSLFGFSFQPSEFLKPVFLVFSAFLMSARDFTHAFRKQLCAFLALCGLALLLVLQPDYGQLILIATVWSCMFFLAGAPLSLLCAVGAIFLLGGLFAYASVPHFHARIASFLTGSGNTFQLEVALEAILNGGWIGVGPGEGKVKRILPDSYTDFTFAVAAEEYGAIFCLVIILLFFLLLARGLILALHEQHLFKKLAIAGLTLLVVVQALINISVNLQLLPAKGLTLPFLSYGGSSILANALTMGLLLGFTRKYPKKFTSRADLTAEVSGGQ